MNDSGNYAEYTVPRKAEGKFLKAKLLWLAIYAVIVIAYFVLLLKLSMYGVLVVIITLPFVPLIFMTLRHLTWNKYVAVDHKYEIANAKITLYEVHGKKEVEVSESSNMEEDWIIYCAECNEELFDGDPLLDPTP